MMNRIAFALSFAMAFRLAGGDASAAASGNGSATSHVFPQFVDGRLPDGTFYTSTLMVSNPSDLTAASCAIIFRGLRPTMKDTAGNVTSADAFTIEIEAGQGDVLTTPGSAEFRSGYVTIQCEQPIDAVVLYALHGPSGITMSEAAVLSAGQSSLSQLVADQRNGARLGVALNNDSDRPVIVRMKATSYSEAMNGSYSLTIPPRSTVSRFVDEVVALPADFVGQILVESGSDKITVMGFRFAGLAFSTIPANSRLP